jgi:hypothetical protein
MRCTVPVPMPSDLATFKIPTRFASSLRNFRSVALSPIKDKQRPLLLPAVLNAAIFAY